MEVELKLSLDPAAAPALRRHPLLAHYRQGRPWSGQVENDYFDTPALDLQRRGMELRLRRAGGRAWQTLKVVRRAASGQRAPGGLHRLDEWEAPLAGPALAGPSLDVPALVAWLPPGATAAAEQLLVAATQPGFEVQVSTRFRRTTWSLLSAHGDLVELALDIGEVRAGGQTLPLCEVELELKRGEESALFELAHALQAGLPLRPEMRGKAERGFALLAPRPPAPPRPAQAVRLARATAWWVALRTVVEECLVQVQANEAGVVASADIEYVHQMRVGLRRLRSALGLFKGFARPPDAVLEDLRWSADQLGAARDAEVLAYETLSRVPDPADGLVGWPALGDVARAAADAARREAAQAVRTPRHVGWQLALMGWVCGLPGRPVPSSGDAAGKHDMDGAGGPDGLGDAEGAGAGTGTGTDGADGALGALGAVCAAGAPGAAGSSEAADKSLPAFARRRLQRLRKRLARDGERLQRLDAGARHDARVVAKKLRYATELLGGLQPDHRRRRLRSLATLQEQLGRVNDAQVAAQRLAGLATGTPDLAAAAAHAQRWLAADAEQRVRRLGRVWARVRKDL